MVKNGLFREDLYYRVNVFPIHILPLRERPKDVRPLAEIFLERLNRKYNCEKTFSGDLLLSLQQHDWPGNVRELKNSIERAFIMSEGETLRKNDLPVFAQVHNQESGEVFYRNEAESLKVFLARIEYQYIVEAYKRYGNVRDAAKSVDMSPASFVRKRMGFFNDPDTRK